MIAPILLNNHSLPHFIDTTMNPDQDQDQEFISKTTLTNLFRVSLGYHRRRLREIFLAHFKPSKTDAVWTKDLPEQVIQDLRLHLSWDLGHRVFYLNREQIGTRIIIRFQEMGILLFMKKIIHDSLL